MKKWKKIRRKYKIQEELWIGIGGFDMFEQKLEP
jgi:hypothetical protein